MVTIPLKARVNSDGTLDIQVRTGLPESEVDVLVVIQPAALADRWPEGFLDETFGAFADAPLSRPEQPVMEVREPLK